MTTGSIYAAESNGTITHLSEPMGRDEDAQSWHRGLGNPGTLVVLDLGPDESPCVGDSIDIDADGVATLCVTGDPEPDPLEYQIFDADPGSSGGAEWPDTSDGPDPEDYDPEDGADELATDALDWAVSEAVGNSDYSIGDTLWCIVRHPGGSVAVTSRTIEIDDYDGSDDDVLSRDWESVATYVACCYGTDGDEPGTCNVEIGETPYGAWYVRAGDDACTECVAGPFLTRDEADEAASEYASENDEEPDFGELVAEIVETGYFGDADADDVKRVVEAATKYSQGYLLLPPGDVPCPIGIAWTTNGYLWCDHITLDATHDSAVIAADALLRSIRASEFEVAS